LRRRTLRLLRVGEFGPAAQFVEPCVPFRLGDVSCGHCNDCRDLDLCRDPALQRRDWRCPSCAHPYDLPAVEARLIARMHGRLREYALQDVACVKCRRVTAARLRGGGRCESCAGVLRATVSAREAAKRLVVFRSLAAFHGFELLRQLADMALHGGSVGGLLQEEQRAAAAQAQAEAATGEGGRSE